MIGYGADRVAWWLCRPSLGRALLCGAAAIYLGTFIGADAVTMFCAAQVARLVLRAVARRSVRVEAPLPTPWRRERSKVDPAEPDADPRFMVADRFDEANHAPVPACDPEPELTLDELIAGDPGPERGDPRPGLDGREGSASPPDESANGHEPARMAPLVDGDVLPVSAEGNVPVPGSDAAEALRIAVAEPR